MYEGLVHAVIAKINIDPSAERRFHRQCLDKYSLSNLGNMVDYCGQARKSDAIKSNNQFWFLKSCIGHKQSTYVYVHHLYA